ncbi:olfactory receptor 51G2-like [Amia ocellicauda]|uniref:olfactory receptor 51G2-like n=1 Tax=Amia ocellicauda TaxID=2972642 RepID=UPI0034644CDA
MENSSQITYFTLSAYAEMGGAKYLYFMIVLLLFIVIIFLNVVLITVICVERSLHEPMYYFLCSLATNGVYGSIGLFPAVLVNVLSDTHEISRVSCFVQIFILHTYGCGEFTNLAVMAYDRYVSICHPLNYHKMMSTVRVYGLIALTWVFSVGHFFVTITLTVRMQLCRQIMEKIYCVNYSIVKLACEDISALNTYGLISMIYTTFPQLFLIVYSYAKILRVCLKASKESQTKALNTCTSHIITLVNFSFGVFFELIQNRCDMSSVPHAVQIMLSVYFIIFPPLLNPIIYGFNC